MNETVHQKGWCEQNGTGDTDVVESEVRMIENYERTDEKD